MHRKPDELLMHRAPDLVAVHVGGSDTEPPGVLPGGFLSSPVQVPPASFIPERLIWDAGAVAVSVATPEPESGDRCFVAASGHSLGVKSQGVLLPCPDDLGAPNKIADTMSNPGAGGRIADAGAPGDLGWSVIGVGAAGGDTPAAARYPAV